MAGWAIGQQQTADFVIAALTTALTMCKPQAPSGPGQPARTQLVVGKRCKEMGVRPSMGRVSDAYDNVMAESLFASLACKLIDRRSWKSFAEARMAMFIWVAGWYKPRRRHSGIGQKSPINLERCCKTKPSPPSPPPLS